METQISNARMAAPDSVSQAMTSANSRLQTSSTQSDSEVLVRVEGVKKKFCRSLKKSLWYGVKDMASEMLGGKGSHEDLRSDEFWAVNDVSFELKRGECIGLIGHNGAGKTTLLKMLNGLIKPDHGRIEMRGRIGALIALGAGFNPILTGRENIYVNGSVLGLGRSEIENRMEEIIDFADIRDFIDAPVQSYSSGMTVRLGFAIASSCCPDVLLLDEVLAVGDMAFQAKCFNRLGEIRRQGTGFIFVAHNMQQITRFCSKVIYLRHGKVEYLGPAATGVESFLKEMIAKGASEEPEMTGTLAVKLNEVYFTNQSGMPISEIRSGAPVRLVLEYQCQKGPVIEPVLELTLRDSSGEELFHGSNEMAAVSLGVLRDRGCLSIGISNLPANNQQLTASISLWSSDMRELICWRRGFKLYVRGNAKSIGRIMLDCSWENMDAGNVRQPCVLETPAFK